MYDTPMSNPDPQIAPEPPARPANSTITYLPAPDSLTFIIPRAGLRGAAPTLLFFCLLWNIVVWIVFIVLTRNFIAQPNSESALLILFLLLFVGAGALLFFAFIRMAFTMAVIVATPATLVITQKNPLFKRESNWTSNDLKSIAAQGSGTKVNNRPLKELRIILTTDKTHGFFDGRDDAELHWLAQTLRNYYAR
jgi:hypothetical protein